MINEVSVNLLYEKRKQKLIDWLNLHQLRQIQWEATCRCDMECIHCGSSCNSSGYANELTKAEIFNAFDLIAHDFKAEEIELVAITGGEPLMRSDLPDVIEHMNNLGFRNITIQTNGNILINNEKLINSLLYAGLSGIGLSLDGLPEQHDWQRKRKGHFEQVYKLTKWLVENTHLYVMFTTVVNQVNCSDLKKLYEIIQEINPKRWRLIEVQPIGRAHKNSKLLLSRTQYEQLVKFVYNVNFESVFNDTKNHVKIELGCSGWLGKEYEGIVRPYIWHCQAGISSLGIWYDGSIGGCTDINHFFSEGNVRTDSISKIWENGFKKYRDWSSRKSGECFNCSQWEWCHGGSFHLRNQENELLLCTYNNIQKHN